jgi:hypothetical protein
MMTQARIEKCYVYRAADGTPKYETVRYDPKNFRQRQCDGHGSHTWSMVGAERIPYNLPELLAKKAEWTVLFAEGEKDADAVRLHSSNSSFLGGTRYPQFSSCIALGFR